MVLRSFVKINLLFRIMDPLKRKSPSLEKEIFGTLSCNYFLIHQSIYEPRHEISNNVVCGTSKASDQPAHMRNLIRAFASCLNIIGVLSY